GECGAHGTKGEKGSGQFLENPLLQAVCMAYQRAGCKCLCGSATTNAAIGCRPFLLLPHKLSGSPEKIGEFGKKAASGCSGCHNGRVPVTHGPRQRGAWPAAHGRIYIVPPGHCREVPA